MMKMKEAGLRCVLAINVLMVSLSVYAHDIAVQNSDGVTIYYLWRNNKTELSVSYRGSTYYSYEDEYSGNVVIPASVKYNGKTYSVTSISFCAFWGCSRLVSVTIPNSVTYIGDCTFQDCISLTSIAIPNSVTTIGEKAFSGCSSMTTVSIGSGVNRIEDDAFYDCNSLRSVHIADLAAWCNIAYWHEDGGWGNPLQYAHHLYMNGIEIKNLVIPQNVTSISHHAFYGCSGLTSLTIPNSVTSIGSSAFYGCSRLTSIVSEIMNPFKISNYVFDTDIYSSVSLIVPAGTKYIYQTTEGWSKFKTIVEKNTDEAYFTKDGITYQGSKSTRTVVVKAVDKGLKSLEIPASVSYDGTTFRVTGIDNDVFRGCSLGALIWNVETALPNNAFSNASVGSNFLLYVKSSFYAPSSVKNVVVNGTASSIQLSDDGGQFFCPQAFTARNISYTHNYSMETGGSGMGWETLVLPFDVQTVTHSTRGELVPFAAYRSGSSQKPFWLANFSGSGFRRTSAILANEPYIIAMPNSSNYNNNYNLAGDVTFSADNVQVPQTPSFNSSFLPAFSKVTKSSKVYALNVTNRYVTYSGGYYPGSRFISNLRDIRPFEAYMTGSSSTRGVIEINFDDGMADIDDLLLSADGDGEIIIHTLSGQQLARTTQRDFDAVWSRLLKGVYIVNGKKWIK